LGYGLLKLRLRIHHDRSVPGDWLLDRLAGHEQEANALVACLHGDLVTRVEKHKRAIAGFLADEDFISIDLLFAEHTDWLRGGGEYAAAFEHIGEGVALDFNLENLALAGGHEDVEIARISGDAVDRTFLAPEVAAHDAHTRAVVVNDLRNFVCLDVLIARRSHLQ